MPRPILVVRNKSILFFKVYLCCICKQNVSPWMGRLAQHRPLWLQHCSHSFFLSFWPVKDPNRLYYEPAELKVFEDIECEWPLFWTYLLLDGVFNGNKEQADEYAEGLRDILVPMSDSTKAIPELYYVPKDKVWDLSCDGSVIRMWVLNPGRDTCALEHDS